MRNISVVKETPILKRLFVCMLAAVLAFGLVLPLGMQSAYAEPTSAEVQAEADAASARLAAAEEEMEQIGVEYQAAVAAHDEAVAAMEEAQGRIDAAQVIIDETQTRLGEVANQQYRQGPYSFLEVIFGASSFEEFVTNWEYLNFVNAENATLIQTNKDARAEAEEAYEEYSAQEEEAAAREAEAEAIKVEAEELLAAQAALLAGLNAEVAALVEAEQEARYAAEAAAAEQEAINNPPSGTVDPPYNPPAPPTGGYADVVAAAASRIGCAYVYGATGPNSFDCSGLTSWAYTQAGRGWIGRNDSAQYNNASARWSYSSGGAEPGDVLWWPGHVAIYAGGGSYIHAANPSLGVLYSNWNLSSATVLRF